MSLVPILTPMSALAQTGYQTARSDTDQERKGDTHSWRASDVVGKDVKNAGSETIGKVEDLVVDMENGEIIAVIISSGGFLGIGESYSAVPVAVLRYDDRAEGFKTKLTKEQLGRAPQFKANAWPDYSEATNSEALRSFRATLDGADQTSNRKTQDQDNTAQNKKAENRATTPMDQGNSPQDMNMTKNIRSEIMGTDMSSNAKNIKIVSRNERVTLNGVVKSNDEHQEILTIAAKHCEQGRIIDNLQVKGD